MWLRLTFFSRNFFVGSLRTRNFSSRQRKHQTKSVASLSYKELRALRREQARRSIQVQHPECPASEVLEQVDRHGDVQSAFSYQANDKDYLLLELQSEKDARRVLQYTAFFANNQQYPVSSRFLFYQHVTGTSGRRSAGVGAPRLDVVPERGLAEKDLCGQPDLSEEILALQDRLSHTELSTRLRYFIASSVEEFLHRLFPLSSINLFGSSVNGFGKYDCDVDMAMEIGYPPRSASGTPHNGGQLYYMTKQRMDNERLDSQRALEACGSIIQSFFPQCKDVHKILRARVPIVKFNHFASGLDCDLTLNNDSALSMSELLYNVGQADDRVRPLMFTVRHWARCNQVTFSHPGPWPSNFMLTLLVIHFLQARPTPVLPPLGKMLERRVSANRNEVGAAEVFIQSWRNFPQSKNQESLGELLKGFFAFYTAFDFEQSGISVLKASTIPKADGGAMLLENPLEQDHNCSKNVMASHVTVLQEQCHVALETLEALPEQLSHGESRLLSILSARDVTDEPSEQETEVKTNPVKLNVQMRELFSNDDSDTRESKQSSKSVDDSHLTGSNTSKVS